MSWPQVEIQDFCSTGSGTTPSRKKPELFEGNIPWVKSGELRETQILHAQEHVSEAALKTTSLKIVPAGALLVAMYGATVGRVGILGIDATTNQAVCHVVPDPKRADQRYMFHLLQSRAQELVGRGVGGAQPNISQGTIKQLSVPLPPLEEQKRIAGILDQADALRHLRTRAQSRLNTLGQATFHEMFGDLVVNDSGFDPVTVGDVIDGFETGKNLAEDPDAKRAEGYRVLKISAVTSGIFKPEESKPLPLDYEPPHSHIVRDGDLLFSRANTAQLIGATAFARTDKTNLVLPDKLWRFVWKPDSPVLPEFVEALFSSPAFRYEIGKRSSGTSGSMKNVGKQKVLGIAFGLPNMRLQKDFARKLSASNAHADASKRLVSVSNELFASLKHRAFRGEL